MVVEAKSIELAEWMQSAAGRCLLHWEQQQLDHAVVDVFGYHALQLGLPQLDSLRANRMPHRWLATETPSAPLPAAPPRDEVMGVEAVASDAGQRAQAVPALHCDFDALPFPDQCLDLVVLPHTLELSRDPHLSLREVERVLMPEGRVMIVGFNPASRGGLRQRLGRARAAIGLSGRGALFLPRSGELLGYWRVRDWLRLLSFEIEGGRFGVFRPPYASARWLERSAWMEAVGQRWWPVFGAVYFLVAVKRVRGMRLVGLARSESRKARNAATVVTQRRPLPVEELCE